MRVYFVMRVEASTNIYDERCMDVFESYPSGDLGSEIDFPVAVSVLFQRKGLEGFSDTVYGSGRRRHDSDRSHSRDSVLPCGIVDAGSTPSGSLFSGVVDFTAVDVIHYDRRFFDFPGSVGKDQR